MTDHEWQSTSKLRPMMDHVQDKMGLRKARLFACACCRQVWYLLIDARSREAVNTIETWVDNPESQFPISAWHAAGQASADLTRETFRNPAPIRPECIAAAAAYDVATPPEEEAKWKTLNQSVASSVAEGVLGAWMQGEGYGPARAMIERHECYERKLCDLLREILGSPPRARPPDRQILRWNDGSIVNLANEIYQARDFARMQQLREMLVQAGCNELDVLEHCFLEHGHVRGCWVIDWLLGKTVTVLGID